MDKFKIPGFSRNVGHSNTAPDMSNVDQRPRHLLVANCPNNNLALANVASVSPNDFPDNIYVIIDNLFVYTTKHSNDVAPGTVGLNGNQRSWGGWSLNQEVQARAFDLFKYSGKRAYLGTLDIEISFRSRGKAVTTPFDQDELAAQFAKNFESQIFSATQYLVMEFKGHFFDLRIRNLQAIDLGDIEMSNEVQARIEAKGILTKQTQINFFKGRDGLVNLTSSNSMRPRSDAVIRSDFKFEDLGVGGLDKEFTKIFRRAFASRIFPPAVIEKLGITHVKGLLLYGPPGTGKTLIARKIGKMLNAKEPKIVNGPEILSKYVGSSEENIRNLFKDAEAEYKAKGDDSSLHIIIFDELDSVFKQRGSRGDGTGVGDNVVNQLLAKMDGVDQLNNILVIGMTNRKDLIDIALLRPGRFEVQVEIHLPDEPGRLQIFEIQTKKMRENKMMDTDVDLAELAKLTKNFSGAEIEGLVKSASSFAINKTVNIGKGATKLNPKDIAKLKVTRDDFMNALSEVTPAFGINEEDLKMCMEGGIIRYSDRVNSIIKNGERYVRQVRESEKSRLVSLLLHGPPGSGKTALSASIALKSEFPFIRMISPGELSGMSENAKIAYIDSTFRDAYKSPLNILVIDSIETLVDWVPIGPRFSNNILQVLKVALMTKPPEGRRLLIMTTTSTYSVLKQMDILSCFDNEIAIPNLTNLDEFNNVMMDTKFLEDEERVKVVHELSRVTPNFNIGIKKALTNIETARHDDDPVNEIIELMTQA
ncbi:similar to Saccharomyces cerevisiae YBR080C SEC18 ATPase required for vesicular transport between ER and Golgi, the 'priming' step in homotypic vacuole fusion, autophagy, and protein secretion [Maudiozyma barnettii]|uniref:Vesicular-fusion protein SEC18 n=1 Tax=Maudiozyma barnettii TaxID=61262 RepID=A0A8H2VK56_9SACH|nr:similar to Saccharomyces cerevisiae YBR080C SEC18 ATPase required for vesicular transport between ER and Golgi, the 'priming' step in homotypic vacuole fusion, autophagy, and protein secretion [Kazachstania barnettii]CAB4256840.1 similar to Saccharomyces cerevisiae YBR080C SEC18 ATPase required for vesicular transport between ER and Golgi, the 'priming' step in homotypic vacuole fusion, autophagy, and protein secretion [Kazachstania barnettii]CAD1785258.1 similar to Saccharomyces cerevisiae YB